MREHSKKTIGVDLGDRWSHYCVLDGNGDVVDRGRVRTKRERFAARFGKLEPARIALEVGTHSPYLSRLLAEQGHEVLVANPRRLKLIFADHTKSDKVDAESLARLARVDPGLLSCIEHRTEQAQADRAVLRSRDVLVRVRAGLVNHVRGMAKSLGYRLPSCHARAFANKSGPELPDVLRAALDPVVEQIATLTCTIRAVEAEIERISAERYPVTVHLRGIRGVGPVTALAFVVTIGDPRRFSRSRKVGSYLGLRPRQRQSGERDPQLHVTKAGDSFLRRLLLQCAHYILGPFGGDCDLRRWGLKFVERGGGPIAKKKAVVAVARKLAVRMHRLWVTGEIYDPLYLAKERGDVVATPA